MPRYVSYQQFNAADTAALTSTCAGATNTPVTLAGNYPFNLDYVKVAETNATIGTALTARNITTANFTTGASFAGGNTPGTHFGRYSDATPTTFRFVPILTVQNIVFLVVSDTGILDLGQQGTLISLNYQPVLSSVNSTTLKINNLFTAAAGTNPATGTLGGTAAGTVITTAIVQAAMPNASRFFLYLAFDIVNDTSTFGGTNANDTGASVRIPTEIIQSNFREVVMPRMLDLARSHNKQSKNASISANDVIEQRQRSAALYSMVNRTQTSSFTGMQSWIGTVLATAPTTRRPSITGSILIDGSMNIDNQPRKIAREKHMGDLYNNDLSIRWGRSGYGVQ